MKFTEKNTFIVEHRSSSFYEKDLELFTQHCPNSKLMPEIKRATSFVKTKLDGMMLLELLDKVSPEVILQNRSITPQSVSENHIPNPNPDEEENPLDPTSGDPVGPITDDSSPKKKTKKKSSPK
ncbi:hypothetical protein MASR1M31_03470 [Porphyromonadaceae bacterium]